MLRFISDIDVFWRSIWQVSQHEAKSVRFWTVLVNIFQDVTMEIDAIVLIVVFMV